MNRFVCILLGLALPFFAIAQEQKKETPAAPKKETISSYRITVKSGHDDAFKAALASHAQKFHKGDWSWRVGEVMSGPDGGTYHIVEGPFSWTAFDDRGDLGAEHTKDYETNIAPHVEKTTPDTFATYTAELSTVAATNWSNKVLVRHITVKPGKNSGAFEMLKAWKAVYEKRGMNVAVWHSAWSGENVYSVVFRLKNGWKDLDADLPSMRKTVEEISGPNEYARLLQGAADNYEKVVDEMIEFKPDLSSK